MLELFLRLFSYFFLPTIGLIFPLYLCFALFCICMCVVVVVVCLFVCLVFGGRGGGRRGWGKEWGGGGEKKVEKESK